MEGLAELLDRVKSRVVIEWSECGVPPPLLEAVAAHAVEELAIALELSRAAGCDPGRVALLALAHELGGEVRGLEDALRDFHALGSREAAVARLAHELARVVQAKRYARMGFRVEGALRRHAEEALRVASVIAEGDLAQLVHELLTS